MAYKGYGRLAALVCCVTAGSACSPSHTRTGLAPSSADVQLAVVGSLNRMPSLASAGARVAVAWTSTLNDVMDAYVAISNDGGVTFRQPVRVNHIPGDVSSNAEQPPRVSINGGAITVVWPSRRDGSAAIRFAQSTDGGLTFPPAANLHAAALTGLRGWQGLAPGLNGGFLAIWLDGRNAALSTESHRHHASRGSSPPHGSKTSAPRQDVYAAVLQSDGGIVETHVARDVCFCCKAAIGLGPSGRVSVAWRHIFADSMRDIAMATSTDQGRTFGQASRVSEDNWQLSGCPDDGPSLAVDTRDVIHLAWATFLSDSNQKAVFYTWTTDGQSFAPRIRLSGSDREDAGHPQIAVDGAGAAAVVWDEQRGDDRKIVFRRVVGRGEFRAAEVLNASGTALHPVVAGLQQGFLVAWPESADGRSSIRIRRIR